MNLLATLIPSYLTQAIINLDRRSIVLIDTRTFMGLSHITNLSLSDIFKYHSNFKSNFKLSLRFKNIKRIDSYTSNDRLEFDLSICSPQFTRSHLRQKIRFLGWASNSDICT